MKRREFLGVAAAATALGGLEVTPASGQETKAGADPKANAAQLYKRHAPSRRQHDRPLPDLSEMSGMKLQKAEAAVPSAYHEKEISRIKELGLEPVDSIQDKTEFSCFQHGSLPHWSGINTFLKLPYLEDVRKVGEYDVAFVGVPFDIGCTFRTGTRFGPQGIRRISALYQKYSYEYEVDLSETLAMCDVGDIFCPPTSPRATTRSPRASRTSCPRAQCQ
jgi:agmatinase